MSKTVRVHTSYLESVVAMLEGVSSAINHDNDVELVSGDTCLGHYTPAQALIKIAELMREDLLS